MKKINFFPLFILVLGIFLTNTACSEDEIISPVSGKVIDSLTKDPIIDARVIYNADLTVFTDTFGEFRLEYNLGHFLADSISLFVSKEEYKDRNFSSIVGNTQKDIFVIELDPK